MDTPAAQPLPWQPPAIDAAAHALSGMHSFLDASDTGVGKTFTALFALKKLGARGAIVCPKAVIPSWVEAAARVGVELLFASNVEALKANQLPQFVKGSGKIWKWALPEDVIAVVDEVHRFSAPDSQNASFLLRIPPPVLMASRTPANSPLRMRAIGTQLGLTNWFKWEEWARSLGVQDGEFGGLTFGGSAYYLDQLHRQIFEAGRGYRVRIEDIRRDFPDAFPDNRIETKLVPWVDPRKVAPEATEILHRRMAEATTHLAVRSFERQLLELAKIPAIIELAEDSLAEGNSVPIFLNFRESIDILAEHFKDAAIIHGERKDRKDQLALFQRNQVMVALVQNRAGGEGLGFQDLAGGHPRTPLICPSESADNLIQIVGRTPRAGAKSPVTQTILFVAGSMEEGIRANVERNKRQIDLITDGDLMNESTVPAQQSPSSPPRTRRRRQDPTPVQTGEPGVPAGSGSGPAQPGGAESTSIAVRGSDNPVAVSVPVEVIPDTKPKRYASSPSRLKNLEVSPAYKEDPTRPPHPITEAGLRMHEALETGDDSKLKDDTELLMVNKCRGYEADLIASLPDYKDWKEIEFNAIWKDMMGRADRVIVSFKQRRAYLIDYKFSQNLQEDTETNPAAQAYVLGIFDRWGASVDEVEVHYLYPILHASSYHTYTKADIARIKNRIEIIHARRDKATPETCAYDDSTCTYCTYLHSCPTAHKALLPIATRFAEKNALPLPTLPDFSQITNPAHWARLLSYAPVFEELAAIIKKFALEFRNTRGEIPGYERVERRGSRKVVSVVLLWQHLEKQGWSLDDFLALADVGVTDLEKAASEKAPKGEKTKIAQEFIGKLRDAALIEVGPETYYLKKSKAIAKT